MTANERAVPHYLLYGSRASYYTMKVFAYLRYKGLPFDLVKVTDQIAEDVIKPLTGGWRVVPVLYGPDSGYVQDSSLILDRLESLHSQHSIQPTGLKQRVVAALFELLGDDWLVFPAMHYRWNFKRYNLPYILKTFGRNQTHAKKDFQQFLNHTKLQKPQRHVNGRTVPNSNADFHYGSSMRDKGIIYGQR
jgi:glutathione S-transferase